MTSSQPNKESAQEIDFDDQSEVAIQFMDEMRIYDKQFLMDNFPYFCNLLSGNFKVPKKINLRTYFAFQFTNIVRHIMFDESLNIRSLQLAEYLGYTDRKISISFVVSKKKTEGILNNFTDDMEAYLAASTGIINLPIVGHDGVFIRHRNQFSFTGIIQNKEYDYNIAGPFYCKCGRTEYNVPVQSGKYFPQVFIKLKCGGCNKEYEIYFDVITTYI